MQEVNANQFREMYSAMNINIDKLGCIMLDVDGSVMPKMPNEDYLYFTKNPDRFWIKGFVAGHTPHVTLLYGLLESGNTVYREYVDKVLSGWGIESVESDHVSFFESPYTDDPYYCIVAHIKVSNELLEGNQRLQLLPHINTFPTYKPHITIAYVKKDEAIKNEVIDYYNKNLSSVMFKVKEINYGK